jgi:hypothetical protein
MFTLQADRAEIKWRHDSGGTAAEIRVIPELGHRKTFKRKGRISASRIAYACPDAQLRP